MNLAQIDSIQLSDIQKAQLWQMIDSKKPINLNELINRHDVRDAQNNPTFCQNVNTAEQ
jgi:hypothetical protein